MKKVLILLAVLLMGSYVLMAQDKTLTGKLTDEKNGHLQLLYMGYWDRFMLFISYLPGKIKYTNK